MATILELREGPHWSYSAMNTYLNMCSLKYAFQYVYGTEPERTAASLPFGRAFHIAATEHARLVMKGKRLTLLELHEVFAEWFKVECAACVNLVFKNGETMDSLIEQAKFMLDALLARWIDWKNIVSVAQAFSIEVPGLNRPFIGEYDMVIKENNCSTIVDWKTSATRWPSGKADKDLQATAFSYAFAQASGKVPNFRFDVVTKTKNPNLDNLYTSRDNEDFERFVKLANLVNQAVNKEVFLPAETSFCCGDCQFANACKSWGCRRKAA